MNKIEHNWEAVWVDTDKPHPGFGGSGNIYGYYASQCSKCGVYLSEAIKNSESCIKQKVNKTNKIS